MALEPITRQEQVVAGKDLKPITRMEMFLKQYGGGSGGADWNAAEGEPGHILNRPFYIETTPDLVFTADDIANPIERIENPDLEGMAYVKVSDRVFTADELDGMSVTYISGDDNLEPVTTTELFIDKDHTFLPTGIMFSSMNDGTALGVVIEQETNMGFRISTGLWLIDYGSIGSAKILYVTIPGGETVKPLDEKFMPILTSPNGTRFRIAVNDDGALTAAEV